ncbi:MAG: formate dehydrogenase accessory sulfurtransferase FdhD [Alphaproteobacteria bacterium]|nr:formate dehydrogenase accessory sulfurtransferase FdhD [Alphaproteobacteria bacterium]
MLPSLTTISRQAWRDGAITSGTRVIPEEAALALTYNGGTYAVMMGTPHDLRDFAIGFSLSEGIIAGPDEILSFDIIELGGGVELRMWLAPERAATINSRRRHIAGPTGCGICGTESVTQALRPATIVPEGRSFTPLEIMTAIASLPPFQEMNQATGALHAAAFWTPGDGIVALREDVGRHNALDKLAGFLSPGPLHACDGIVLLTSRVSVEMVQKAATMGAPLIVAVSAPTGLAVRTADKAEMTLCAIARPDGFEVFTHPRRIAVGT